MKKIKSKDMLNKVKQMKKDGIKFEEVMFFVFIEMMEKKSSQLVMDLTNDKGESVKLVVGITDGEEESFKEEPISNATRSMVS